MLRILIIARATFWETIRQPIYGILICLAGGLLAFSPQFAMFTLLENIRLVKEMGLSTIFLAGVALAVLAATQGVSSEIEGGTALTLLAKPVSRAAFVLGKFAGLAVSLVGAVYLLSIVLLMAVRAGVPEAAWSKLDPLPLWAGLAATVVPVGVGLLANFFFDRHFQATAIATAFFTFSACWVLLALVGKDLQLVPFPSGIDTGVVRGCVLVGLAVLLMAAAGVAFSMRFSYGAGVLACSIFGLWALLSDYLFGRHAAGGPVAAAAYALSPNLQVLWAADAVSAGKAIPLSYIGLGLLHSSLWAAALLGIGVFLFEGREMSGRV